MRASAKEGACLAALIELAIPICQRAEREHPRKGPGRRPTIPDWMMAVLIVVAIAKQRKSKSSQYRFLKAHSSFLKVKLEVDCFPSRSTYFDRYRRAWLLYESAIRLTGEKAIRKKLVSARCVAVDKSVVAARGPKWNKRHVACNRVPKAADLDATWTRSAHQGWILGYGYEVVVSAQKTGTVWPLLASAGRASWQPNRTFPNKIQYLHRDTRYVLADRGYDSNTLAELVEFTPTGNRTGRRMLCTLYRGANRTLNPNRKETRRRKGRRLRREARAAFLSRPFAQRLTRRRKIKVEPFNDWFKSRFDLYRHAWHRGLDNNRTQILAAIFTYQILLLINHQRGRNNGCIQWLLDEL